MTAAFSRSGKRGGFGEGGATLKGGGKINGERIKAANVGGLKEEDRKNAKKRTSERG